MSGIQVPDFPYWGGRPGQQDTAREACGPDGSARDLRPAVVCPGRWQEISQALRLCHLHGRPVLDPGLLGLVWPNPCHYEHGKICLSLSCLSNKQII